MAPQGTITKRRLRTELEEAQTDRSLFRPTLPGRGRESRGQSGWAPVDASHRPFPRGDIAGGAARSFGETFFLPRDRLTEDDIYIFMKPLISSFITCQRPRPFHGTWNVCTHPTIPFAKQTSQSPRGNSLTLLRLLISPVSVAL